MQENRSQVIAWIGLSEGGLVNHPDDPGGLTNRGITQRTYAAWRKGQGLPAASVKNITKAEADQIISQQYLTPVMFDQLPAGLDYSVADFSVNSGPARAVRELQVVAGMSGAQIDGIMGAQTLEAISRVNTESLILAYNLRRMAFLKRLKNWPTFGKGWTARVMGRKDGFQSDDIGVIDRSVMLARGAQTIPDPKKAATPKTDDAQISETAILQKVLADPVALVPVLGSLGGILTGAGPVQWAIALVVAGGALFWAMRQLKRRAA